MPGALWIRGRSYGDSHRGGQPGKTTNGGSRGPKRRGRHYAVADFDEQRREVRRITVAGDIPVSIDGRRSEVILGDASEFADIDGLIS